MKISVEEFQNKIKKIRIIIEQKNIQGILITKQHNFTWLTGGRAFVGLASEDAMGKILITMNKVYLISNNIEGNRLMREEVVGQDITDKFFDWYDNAAEKKQIDKIIKEGQLLLTDQALAAEFFDLRKTMTALELEKYRELGKDAADILEETCREISTGHSEFEVAGILAAKLWKAGIEPTTVLIGFDERAFQYRHPIPTATKLEKYGLLVLSVRRHGLFINCSRLVHFGTPSDEIFKRLEAVTKVDAAYILNTRPGVRACDIFSFAVDMYKETGYKDEWKFHHQGGLTGYAGREYKAAYDTENIVELNQVFAWNPTIAGTKSEDTIIVLEEGNEIITRTGSYPEIEVEYNGKKIFRPGILIR